MFKSARWRSEKNKVKVVFKLQFHAAQLTQVGLEALMISLVPAENGKPTVKSDKASVRDGSCFWENPVYETVKFNREPKSGKFQERIYYFVVGTGSSKAGVIGEASIDFSSYAEATKVSLVSLPLKNSKTEAVLNVSIQRIQEPTDQREDEEHDDPKLNAKDHSLRSQLSAIDTDGIIRSTSFEDVPFNKTIAAVTDLNGNRRASIGSDITISSSGSSSGVETPWEPQMKNMNVQLEPSTDDTSSTPRETFLIRHTEEATDEIEKLKTEISALSRQAEMSELELQTLRKQIVKESKRGQDLFKEVACLKEERDALKASEKRVVSRRHLDEVTRGSRRFEGEDSQAIVEELRQELNHAKELNANLQIQLQKTQESNSELLLAVRDLDEMLEQKNKEIANMSDASVTDVNNKSSQEVVVFVCQSDDEEQNALEELVKEHTDVKESHLLEQQIMDLRSEIEIYKRHKDDLEMQMEQLALDYEITKQENHEMSYKLEQSQLQEQLKIQYECSPNYTSACEQESQIENLENELDRRAKESADLLVTISELEAHVKTLEEELEQQAQGFEADLESLTRSKIEQEQRAIKAEETLRKTRWQNANTAERLQEEFRRLSVQMTSTFEANEKLAAKALAEANELRYQKCHLEELLRKSSEERESVKDHYEERIVQLSGQVASMKIQIEQLHVEIKDREVQLEHQKKNAEETQRLLSDEISMLRDELEMLLAKDKILSGDAVAKEQLTRELAQMHASIKEMELLMNLGNEERIELENRVTAVKNEAEESHKELNRLRHLVEEKELMVRNLQSELDSLQSESTVLRNSLLEDKLEKEKLSKQVLQLKSELKKREDALNSMQKKIKDGNRSAQVTSKTGKFITHAPKEVANLKEKIKLLEGQIKVKEAALERSANTFLEKENDLHSKIEELEGRLEAIFESSTHFSEKQLQEVSSIPEDQVPNCTSASGKSGDDCSSEAPKCSTHGNGNLDDLTKEMALLKERNTSMEEELKEMQGRYSEISLKFAEVEGERQKLVMRVRNLQNSKKSSS